MASLIKNQILKHLSKFTKNLSPDKLQLSAIKGSCEVNNIELNENVLMELLELPVWMSLTRAYCNYASIKIQWMKLKTVPIYLVLDEVIIESETCENFRDEIVNSRLKHEFSYQDTGSYGFTQKVFDGITLSINSVVIQFSSKIFSASFELTRLTVESRNYNFKKVDDLSKTRIRDPARGQVLVFKHIEWQTLRFVAKSETTNSIGQAPLRLIANQASCRITLKKRLSDCAMLGARIMLIFDDLLWVLTDSQLLSALHFADYLGDLIKRAPSTKKFENDSKMNYQTKAKLFNMNPNSPTKKTPTSMPNSISLFFSKYDFLETCYHLIVRRIEVHLMDDLGPHSQKSHCPELKEGGALQMVFSKLLIDFYPYQSINGSRNHWFHYSEPSSSRQSFINHKLQTFYLKQQTNFKNEGSNFNCQSLYSHLMSRVLLIRLSDYTIGCVSTNSNSSLNKRNKAEQEVLKLIFFDKSTVIPNNVSPIYIELNNYFYVNPFDKLNLPLPNPNVFLSVASVKVHFEPITILWINAFFANLHNALMKLQEAFPTPDSKQDKTNIRAEIVMPTIVFRSDNELQSSPNDESSLEVKISKILIYNCDSFINVDYFKGLGNLMKKFASNLNFFYEQTQYPWLSSDMKPISTEFIHKISRISISNSIETKENLPEEDFDLDFLSVNIEPIWIEFKTANSNRSEPILEPINLTMWVNKTSENNCDSKVDLNILANITESVKVQLNRSQLLFILRLLEKVGEFTAMLNYDTYMIQRNHFKRDLEKKFTEDKLCSFDIEEKVVQSIFKNSSFVSNISEIILILNLKEETEILEETKLEENIELCTLSENDHSFKLEEPDAQSIDTSKNVPCVAENNCQQNEIDGSLFENMSEKYCPTDSQKLFVSNYSNIDIPNSNTSLISSDAITTADKMSTSVSSENLKHGHSVLVKKTNFASNSSLSFDSTSLKIHYMADEDTLSTLSDISGDDSDKQSFIATINDNLTDNFDEIFLNDEPVEEAIEMEENIRLTNEDEDTLNDVCCQNQMDSTSTITYIDALEAKIKDLNVIQQSSKGFLSQVFLETSVSKVQEHIRINKQEFDNLLKQTNSDLDVCSESEPNGKVTLRIDSFTKGTLKDELISVRVQRIQQGLNKETIDKIVEFFNDNVTDKVAPTSILLENVQFTIFDNSVRVPPAVFMIPKLSLARNKENKWIIEFNTNLPKEIPHYNQLLLSHLKIFERNLLFNIKDLIKEQDRLNMTESMLLKKTDIDDIQHVLDQVLSQKDLLLQEIDLLRKENEELKKCLNKNNL